MINIHIPAESSAFTGFFAHGNNVPGGLQGPQPPARHLKIRSASITLFRVRAGNAGVGEERMGVSWIEHKGKKILHIDYRGAKGADDSLPILRQAIEIERGSEGNMLLLQNYTGTYANEKFYEEIKVLGKEVQDKVFRNAVVGFDSIKRILLAGYRFFTGDKTIRTFDDEESAKEWLVSE